MSQQKEQRDSIYCLKCQAWKNNYKEFGQFIICRDCGDVINANKTHVIRAFRPRVSGEKEKV